MIVTIDKLTEHDTAQIELDAKAVGADGASYWWLGSVMNATALPGDETLFAIAAQAFG